MGKGVLVVCAAALSAIAGCTTSKSGDVYSRDEALREQSVRRATVESVRPVTLQGTRSGVGAVAGGAVGGLLGIEWVYAVIAVILIATAAASAILIREPRGLVRR